ncbi:MAG TPA: energy transducer TonB [Acidobacteriota bacterium]|nr:energy transducer TonB [Acidobacteriota bacterium]
MTDRIEDEAMVDDQTSLVEKVQDFFQWLLALKVTDEERVLVTDPGNIYLDDVSQRRPMIVAAVLAFLVHLLLLIITFPNLAQDLIVSQAPVLKLQQLARPAGGGPPEVKVVEPEIEKVVAPKPDPTPVPIPDPTPLEPDPIVRETTLQVDRVLDEMAIDLNIGDITGPPSGLGQGNTGTGTGPADGSGASDGLDGAYQYGQPGVTAPELIKQTRPAYTDEAIKAKVQGTILLQMVVFEDGSTGQFKVLRPLGYGLEEKAIEAISNEWQFRPGTHRGEPAPVLVIVEVTFTLR